MAAAIGSGTFVIDALRTENNGYIIFQDPIFYNLLFIIYGLFVTISWIRLVIALAGGVFCFWIKCRKIFRIVWK